jgi:hypothetical protein
MGKCMFFFWNLVSLDLCVHVRVLFSALSWVFTFCDFFLFNELIETNWCYYEIV